MRRPIIAGNWKLFKTPLETRDFFAAFRPLVNGVDHAEVILAPPFTALEAAVDATADSTIAIGAQDVFWESEGAFTGEISAPMLADIGCRYVIVGHSERRQYFGETDETVARKLPPVVAAGMDAILCVGETLSERESGEAEIIVSRQLKGGLAKLTGPDLSHIIVAYEPVWAIGTGQTATPEIAQQMHKVIRDVVSREKGDAVAQNLRILYGGSVKPANIAELMRAPDIDGALVGGASLEADSFAKIVRYTER
jgi:triosephosphate isomerase (TIM)